jgi:DNA-binding GntR family transcriptional regulator
MEKKTKPLREVVYNKIVDQISDGEISPGETLNERDLAERFNVSRTPVREAFLQLEKVGMIVRNANSGAVVKKITTEQTEEILNIISVLEGYAAETAVVRGIEGKDLKRIKEIGKKMESHTKNKDFFKFAETNRTFHEFVVKKAGNNTLEGILKELNTRVYTGGLTVPFYIDQYWAKHKLILEAIENRLPARAGAEMREHNQDIKKFLLKSLRHFRAINSLQTSN